MTESTPSTDETQNPADAAAGAPETPQGEQAAQTPAEEPTGAETPADESQEPAAEPAGDSIDLTANEAATGPADTTAAPVDEEPARIPAEVRNAIHDLRTESRDDISRTLHELSNKEQGVIDDANVAAMRIQANYLVAAEGILSHIGINRLREASINALRNSFLLALDAIVVDANTIIGD